MTKNIQAIRGMNDILPDEISYWQFIEGHLRQILKSYCYQEIRFPIVESTDLFKRSIGEVTDVVEKEMYTFSDRNGDSLTLRPEGTAGCVRAGIQHGLFYNQVQRLWYMGPMFRHERPQKGRYRQFYQVGVEAYGMDTPDIDAEIILMTAAFWKAINLDKFVSLQINCLGSTEARNKYREALIQYYQQDESKLDEDSKRRLHTNPLRILDSKNPEMQELNAGAPSLLDYLDEASKSHFETICKYLDAAKITYEINPRLVRGLDYYTGTVFEWVTTELGAQGTVCAGGRYDGLVEQLGGKTTPAVGFALGIERLVILYSELLKTEMESQADIYIISNEGKAREQALLIADEIRSKLIYIKAMSHCGAGSFKSQFKKADKSGASIALIIGDDELENETVTIKYLRDDKEQQSIKRSELSQVLESLISKNK